MSHERGLIARQAGTVLVGQVAVVALVERHVVSLPKRVHKLRCST